MKRYQLIPSAALVCGVICFFLRLVQNRIGFEPGTGLPIAGSPLSIALPAVLAATALLILVLSRGLPSEKEDTKLPFTGYFFTKGPLLPTLLVSAVFLWILSGGVDILSFLRQSPVRNMEVIASSGTFSSSRTLFLMALLTIVSAVSLFPLAVACRRSETAEFPALNSNLLLVPVACLVVRLVLVYREDSVNPTLSAYYVEILALTFLILSLYRASSFAFHCGRTRRFAVYTAFSLTLCIVGLADCRRISDALFFLGGALLMSSLLAMRLDVVSQRFPSQS